MIKENKENNTEISERISLVIVSLSITQNYFAKKLGYQRSQTIYDIINAKSAPSYDFFKRFQLSEYSEIINIDWLLTGRGNMLKEKKAEIEAKSNLAPEFIQILREKDEQILKIAEENWNLKAEIAALKKDKKPTFYGNVAEP